MNMCVCVCGREFHSQEWLTHHMDACAKAQESKKQPSEYDQMKKQYDDLKERNRAAIANAECARWVAAMEELGFVAQPGLSVKENLHAFGEWFSRRKAAGN